VNNNPISGGILAPVLALMLALAAPVRGVADEGDPPERVARVNLLEGAGALQPAGSAEWLTDLLNRPLTAGDKLMIDGASRAELHVGSTAIRLAAQTSLQLLDVGDPSERFGLPSGSLNMRVRVLDADDTIEVDTPSLAVTVLAPGEYRIDVDSAAQVVTVGVIDGLAEVTGRTQDYRLEAQQQGSFVGDLDLTVSFADLGAADGFDAWAALRDAHDDPLYAADRAPPEATGYEDLNDAYGTWQETVDFGPVWVPQVPPGWMPYQVGRWIWVAPWGWTWQDAAPWGFAPFHYGRWLAVGKAWAWSPGDLSVRPVYAPALVDWIYAAGSVAWVPLGVGEVYRPPYRASADYSLALNAAAIRDRAGRLASNWLVPGAVALVPAGGFAAGRPLAGRLAHLDPRSAKRTTSTAVPAAPNIGRVTWPTESSARTTKADAVFTRPLVATRRSMGMGQALQSGQAAASGRSGTTFRDPSQAAPKSSRAPPKLVEPRERPAEHPQPARQPSPPKPDSH